MTTIAEKDRPTIRELLARELVTDVELLLFTRGRSRLFVPGRQECLTCDETRELLEELVGLSDRLHLATHDVGTDPATATQLNVTAVPTVIVRRHIGEVGPTDDPTPPGGMTVSPPDASAQAAMQSSADPDDSPDVGSPISDAQRANVRFLGLPGGYEFSTLVADVVDVSKGRTDLAPETREAVLAIDTPTHIQVFVTPT